jgi:hypothetical protein
MIDHDWRNSDVRVFAADAADGRGCLSDRLFKRWWDRQNLASTAIEDGSQLSTEPPVFILPKIDRKDSIPSTKEQLRDYVWSHPFWNGGQTMERDR